MRYVLLIALVAVCPLASSLAAQRLVGLTAGASPTSPTVTMQPLCDPPIALCQAAAPPPTTRYAGGAVYNPLWNSVFYTDGNRIWEQRIDGCPVVCDGPATRFLGPGSLASGLALDPSRRELFELETIAGFAAITTWRPLTGGVCPKPATSCRIQLPSAVHHAGAIAFDQRRQLVWVASSEFSGGSPASVLLVYRRDVPCQPICRIPVARCLNGTLGPIRAMAYDECAERIYVSDGRQTSIHRVVWSPTSGCPILLPVDCCPLNDPTGKEWVGFDLRSSLPKQLGAGCTGRPCPSCPAMAHGAVGAAVVGNPEFRFLITNAPTGSTGYVLFHAGSCSGGVPFLCGRLWLSLSTPLAVIGPHTLAGPGTCGGAGAFYLAIPNDFALCGALLCSQGLVLCPSGSQLGLGLTNALVTPIGT